MLSLLLKKKDIPKQRIKIEVINVSSYSREPHTLKLNYNFLPDGYDDMLIMVESLNEIMADKLISLVNNIRHVCYRDIWDLHWIKQHNAIIHPQFILDKIQDYKISDYPEKLEKMILNIEEIILDKKFNAEISRFTPLEAQERTIKKDKFIQFLANEIKSQLLEVKKIIQ